MLDVTQLHHQHSRGCAPPLTASEPCLRAYAYTTQQTRRSPPLNVRAGKGPRSSREIRTCGASGQVAVLLPLRDVLFEEFISQLDGAGAAVVCQQPPWHVRLYYGTTHTACVRSSLEQHHITALRELREAEVPDSAQTRPMTITNQSHALRTVLWPSCTQDSTDLHISSHAPTSTSALLVGNALCLQSEAGQAHAPL